MRRSSSAQYKGISDRDTLMTDSILNLFKERRALLEGQDQKERILEIVRGIVGAFIDARCPEGAQTHTFDLDGLQSDILTQFGVKVADPVSKVMETLRRPTTRVTEPVPL